MAHVLSVTLHAAVHAIFLFVNCTVFSILEIVFCNTAHNFEGIMSWVIVGFFYLLVSCQFVNCFLTTKGTVSSGFSKKKWAIVNFYWFYLQHGAVLENVSSSFLSCQLFPSWPSKASLLINELCALEYPLLTKLAN